jgi:hypothetical protein
MAYCRTDLVQVEMVTYNAQQDLFCICSFSFKWQTSGTTKWDYKCNSLSVTPYPPGSHSIVRFLLELILAAMILVNIYMEFREFAVACMHFKALEYLTDPFNAVDWLHFVFLLLTVGYWGRFWHLSQSFQIPESFSILHDVNTDVRPFLTDAAQEYAFLVFVDTLVAISEAHATYTTFSGVCVLLFVSRILKSLDFQERMGLVTKTIEVSGVVQRTRNLC